MRYREPKYVISPVERPVAGAAYGFVRFIGGGLAPFAAGKLVEHFNLHVPFAIAAVAAVFAAVVLSAAHNTLADADRGLDEDGHQVVENDETISSEIGDEFGGAPARSTRRSRSARGADALRPTIHNAAAPRKRGAAAFCVVDQWAANSSRRRSSQRTMGVATTPCTSTDNATVNPPIDQSSASCGRLLCDDAYAR